jgi:hypothetical protein
MFRKKRFTVKVRMTVEEFLPGTLEHKFAFSDKLIVRRLSEFGYVALSIVDVGC